VNKGYHTYRIQIVSREPGRVKVEKRNSQNQSLPDIPFTDLRYSEKLDAITALVKKAQGNQLNKAEQIKELGETLFDTLFDEKLSEDFLSFYDKIVQQEKQFLRIELDIDEQIMPDVAALPWEFMCTPARLNRDIWLGTDPKLIFSRHRSQWSEQVSIGLEKGEKLRIALVVSDPPDLEEFDYQPLQNLLEALSNSHAEQIELLPIVTQADRKSINETLEKKPHILHFIGHGQLEDEQGQEVGQIALVDKEVEQADWVNADEFSRLLAQHRPGIVVLQACEGGAISSSQAFAGVASKIVQQNIPVVIAMQYLVRINIANKFTGCFYEQLSKGYPVDIAAQLGRLAIALEPPQYKKRDFATPVLFMRGQDGYLFQESGVEIEPVTPEKIMQVVANIRVKILQGGNLTGIDVTNSPPTNGSFESNVNVDQATDANITGFKM